MSKLIIIGLGGFVGALVRYGLSGFVQALSKNITFPFGTLAINLLGCLLIGAFAQLIETQASFSADTRDFIFIGLLGAFTTFSTFSNETFGLMQRGDMLLAFENIGMHLIFGLGAVWLGRVTMAQFIT
jgi:CrcB protein